MDLISVIVPVYNVEAYLGRCVESILQQTYKNLEIILVDDGSTDSCPHLCDEWAKIDERIIVIHKKNGGLSDARNAGLNIATGDYIGFVDSDDWIAPEMYERLLSAIYENQSDISACTVEMVWENGLERRLLTIRENMILDSDAAQEALLMETKLKQPVWYKLYRKKAIDGISFEKGKCHEDVFWSYQAIGNANKVSIIDYIGYYYWQRKDSIMGERYSVKRLDVVEAYCRRYEYIKVEFPNLEAKAKRALWMHCIYHGQMTLRYVYGKDRKKVFLFLKEIIKQYPLRSKDLRKAKFSHFIWFCLAKIELGLVCRARNVLKVGV